MQVTKINLRQKVKVEIYHDPDVDSPCQEEAQWRLYSFNIRHDSFASPRQFFRNGKPVLELRNKLRVGTAFILSCFEHGNCLWALSNESHDVPVGDWYWDGQDVAGVLTWECTTAELGARSLEDRRADATSFLETYTSWCNGETYGYNVHTEQGEFVDGCGQIRSASITPCRTCWST
ncbi:hypothetical protein AB0C84_42880 [Actinomadura sp. NPDC048955]|uniref:hypothetical protein n=1 Tax=Actinomadura sp. NPDC048955 TaxID=3158228 RepID=UPI0033D46D70